ncbi:hypothetical protein AJ87_47165 [Rhizobium yanglingense]|nr:hypothetical protein AJ87_47165 [Rhizobium yanglingense]
MPVRNIDVVGQRRSRQMAAYIPDVDDLMGHTQAFGACSREIEFLAVPLSVVEGEKADEFVFRGNLVRKRNGVQSAGADDNGFHDVGSLVLTGWAATGLRERF